MKRRLSILLTILTVAAVGTVSWIYLQQALDRRAAHGAQKDAQHLLFSDNLSEADKARLQKVQHAIDTQVERQLLRTPVLAVEVRPIPSEQNGYFQLIHWLDQSAQAPLKVPAAIVTMRETKDAWDDAAVNAWLSETESIRTELHRIGSLRESSASGVPITHGLHCVQENVNTLAQALDLLSLEAEASLRLGNFPEAFASVRTAISLIYHLDHQEYTSFAQEQIAASSRLRVMRMMTDTALPYLVAAKAPLDNWVALLRATNRSTPTINRLARGEWHTNMHVSLVPHIYAPARRYIPDPDYVIDAWTDHFCEAIATVEPSFELKPRRIPELSEQGRIFLSKATLDDSFSKWIGIYDHALISGNLAEAAFTLAHLESQGQNAQDSATLKLLPADPNNEGPFAFDPATRVLRSAAVEVQPITVPSQP